MLRRSPLMAALLTLAACVSPPAETTRAIDDRPALTIRNATFGSRLFVDGLEVGAAGNDQLFDFQSPVLLEPGTHLIKVVGPSGAAYEEKVFLSGRGMRTLSIPAGAAP